MAPAADPAIDVFTVMVTKKETVAGVLPLQEHWLPLSNLDLLLPPLDVGVFFCYKRPSGSSSGEKWSFSSMVSILKKSLAQALVSYFALAGEVVSSSLGEPELLCNNRGVDFYEAYADIHLRQLHLYDPDASVEGKLVPPKKEGVLSVQATELKCGGVVVACTFDHRIADAYSINMFLVSWAEMAQSKSLSIQPSFRRSLLNPRRPGSYHPSINSTYVPLSSLPPPNESVEEAHKMISRIYYITAEDINTLQSRASSNGFKRTKLESLSALLWQIVARSEKAAAEKNCAMGIVVDGRTRLSTGNSAICISNYFGNVLSIPYGEEKVEDLVNRPLNWVADAVHRYLKDGANKEHFLGLIDWVEKHRPELAVAKIYCRGSDDGAAFVVSSGQRFPVSKVDFGWGKPVFGSYHFPWGGNSGYVMPMPSMSREGDWVVYMHLSKGQLDLLEVEEGHRFRPLTANYINLAASPAAAAAVE